MPWGVAAAAVGVVGSMVSSSSQASAAQSAADTSAAASNRAADLNMAQYQQTRSDLMPYMNMGTNAGNRLQGIFGLGGGGGQAPAAGPSAAPSVAGLNTGPLNASQQTAATGTGQINQLGFTPSNTPAGLPDGYSYIGGTPAGDGNGAGSAFIVDRGGNLVSLVPDGVPASQVGQWYQAAANPQPQQGQAPGQQGPQQPSNAGALPGSGSSVTPYEAPYGGKFGAQTTFTPGQTTYQSYDPGPGGATYKAFDPGPGGYRFDPTMANLEQTPGYQFQLEQGLRAQQNSATARGLGLSGASLKGATNYATGLAASNWQSQADNFYKGLGAAQTGYNANSGNFYSGQNNALNAYKANAGNFYSGLDEAKGIFADNYNRSANAFNTNLNASTTLNDQYYKYNINPLFELYNSGQNSAARVGALGQQSASTAGQMISNAGASQAAGDIGASRAWANGIQDATGAGYNYLLDRANAPRSVSAANTVYGSGYGTGAGGNSGLGGIY